MKNAMSELLTEQQNYYADRASEYDEWWERKGRYDLGREGNALWWSEVAEVTRFFEASRPAGRALDIAAGTGNWTEFLARHADQVTAIDGSHEVLAINRRRLEHARLIDRVEYQQVDLFAWSPKQRYDVVFMGFWISHIPHALMDSFLTQLANALVSGGNMLLIDNQSASDNPTQGTRTLSEDSELRTLKDGRQSRIVKHFYSPSELTNLFAAHGISATVNVTGKHFVYGIGTKGA